MRFFWTVVSAAILIVALWLFAALFLQGYFGLVTMVPNGLLPDSWSPPSTWATWRDIVIVFTAGFWLLGGLLFVALMVVLIVLALVARRVLVEHAAPALDSLKESLDNVKGTTEFAGETVVSPIIKAYSVVSGVRGGISALGNLPGRIRGRKKKGKR